ncbi:ATP-binding region ATPase domain protein [Candidatus Moduliflexus flocculans]|uniref:histidine kinase n=1 Tax=Candidatus Moduliflexus flocculans TaxID=1499966 RepID=A0A081BQU8_9BACT|nr:ATP-binding region ATPase domain protein [Candidatus Moduliflexus flocculans]
MLLACVVCGYALAVEPSANAALPWWKSDGFRIALALAALAAVFARSRIRLRNVERHNRWLASEVDERTKALTETNARLHQEIAERKGIEQKLRRHSERLEETVKERMAELSLKNEQLRQLEQAVENMQLGLTIANLEGKIIYVNQTEAELHGYMKEELLGQDVNLLAPPELRKPLTVRQIREWKGLIRESSNMRKDGSIFPVWLMSEVVRNVEGEPCAIVTSCEDITERKAIEEERRKYRDHLEELVNERTVELTTANAQLQQEIAERRRAELEIQRAKELAESANRAKSDFLANMSHELRTPLNGILGYTQILKNDVSLPERPRHAIDVIHRSAEHLLMMIGDILDLSKIEARHMMLEFADFRLLEMLATLVEMARVRADQQNIAFYYEPDPALPQIVHGDEKRLRQILLNLLGNATKFTKKGSIIFKVLRLSLNDSEESGVKYHKQRVRFLVEDTGIGISANHIHEIFSAFHQIRNTGCYSEGTGLGLAISQRLVRLMGGELCVESVEGEGSRFWFDLELAALMQEERTPGSFPVAPPRVIGYQGKRRTILIVDDHETNRMILRDLLQPLGFQAHDAANGSEALAVAAECNPDIILMDIIMPVMNGLDATRQFRQMPGMEQCVIIAISASISSEKQQECLRAGCQAFLSKPFRINALFEVLSQHAGIEWVYGDARIVETNERAPICVDENALIPPPPEELERLNQLAKAGMITRLRKELDRLLEEYPDSADFLGRIRNLLKEFQIDEMQRFIQAFIDG